MPAVRDLGGKDPVGVRDSRGRSYGRGWRRRGGGRPGSADGCGSFVARPQVASARGFDRDNPSFLGHMVVDHGVASAVSGDPGSVTVVSGAGNLSASVHMGSGDLRIPEPGSPPAKARHITTPSPGPQLPSSDTQAFGLWTSPCAFWLPSPMPSKPSLSVTRCSRQPRQQNRSGEVVDATTYVTQIRHGRLRNHGHAVPPRCSALAAMTVPCSMAALMIASISRT